MRVWVIYGRGLRVRKSREMCMQRAKIGFWCAVTRRTKPAITRCVAMHIQELQSALFFRYFRRRFFRFFLFREIFSLARCSTSIAANRMCIFSSFNRRFILICSMCLAQAWINFWTYLSGRDASCAHTTETRPGAHQRAMKYSIHICCLWPISP